MAVVQISRIQLRRGKRNEGSGLPQLASGELAWCVDTQELFIGNGAVSEGAPAVGNTKLLTDKDSLLDLGTYGYKADVAAIQTGSDVNFPVVRTIQQRLDERVTSAAYGIESSVINQYEKIQRVIDNLFLDMNYEVEKSRIVLEFLPGTYTFNQTVYLPSYVSIVGAGSQKTVFNYTGTGTAFEFVNDTSTKTSRSTINSTTYINQPKNALLKGFTINTTGNAATAIKLNAVRDSQFLDLEINGSYNDSSASLTATSNGLAMYALSAIVTCQRNIFDNVGINGFANAIFAKQDIRNNRFADCQLVNHRQGFYFGISADGVSAGEQFGPRYTIIENCYFENIDQEGIYIGRGYGNRSISNTFVNVGSNGAGYQDNETSIIRFTTTGNTSELDNFDRSNPVTALQDLEQANFGLVYKREVSGKALYAKKEPRTITLTYNTSLTNLFRLPTVETTSFEINYVLESTFYTQVRRGRILISYDKDADTLQVSDEYEYTGSINEDTRIVFNASSAASTDSIMIQYINNNTFDTNINPTTMTYTYSVLS
jgi:hypothetical protein